MNLQIQKPLIIIGCPRSGTSLLFTILSESKNLFSLYRESMDIFDRFYIRKKEEDNIDFFDDELTEYDLNDKYKNFLLTEFHKYTFNSRIFGYLMRVYLTKKPWLKPFRSLMTESNLVLKNMFFRDYTFVEKTPRNCFRIPFINKLFPDARYIYLTRDGRMNISSLIEGWRKYYNYNRYPRLNLPLTIKGTPQPTWKYVLPPGWQDYVNSSIEEVSAFQWLKSNQYAIEGLKNIDPKRVMRVTYENLIGNTELTVQEICTFANIPYCTGLKKFASCPPVVSTSKNEKPQEDKWLKNKEIIDPLTNKIEPMMKILGYDFEEKELAYS